MVGHIIDEARFANVALHTKYLCTGCKHLLRDAVQASVCGHLFCQSCFRVETTGKTNAHCPECDAVLNPIDCNPQYFNDMCTRRNVDSLVLTCENSWNGCKWEDSFSKLKDHQLTCNHIACPLCNTTQRRGSRFSVCSLCRNVPITCPFKSLGCTWGGLESLDDVSEHIATAGLAHAALIANAIGLRNAGLPDHCMETMKIELNNLVIKVACLEDEVRGMKSELTVLRLNAVTAERMIAQHFNRLGTCSTLLESCQLNTSMCEAATYDGKCMWTIPDYSKHLAEAESGKYLFHISAPFYLTRYGYKLCLKVFLMGNGTGLDTHVSLFLVVMKGLNDAILEWPFKQTFTMMMRDHITKKYYDKTCCTSTTNLSDGVRSPFVRPTEEMNYGGGWTQFISHRDLMKGNYIVEDKLFIECVVT